MTSLPLLSFGALFLLSISQRILAVVIKAPSGSISGQTVTVDQLSVNEFLGIPFAKPPIGDLRFKRPQPIGKWTQILKAEKFHPGCPQYSSNPYPFYDDQSDNSEDCLYLNIWVPSAKSSSKFSVMFWIYGGDFLVGSSRLKFYDGKALAALGDVIVVTINYRLQAFGFLNAGSADAPGNAGMWDIVEALKWVRENIDAFGGDKNSITLFGQNAGGVAIGMFCVSPVTRGLFKRIIMQSGAPTVLDGECNGRDLNNTQRVAQAVNCTSSNMTMKANASSVVKCLRGIDARILAKKFIEVLGMTRPVYPICDNEFLPKRPRQAIIDGDFESVDVLIGSNSGDGALLITESMQDVFGFFGHKDPQINYTFGESILREKFPNETDEVLEQYLSHVNRDDYEKIRLQVFTAEGDYWRTCPSMYFAERFARKSRNVYYYLLTHRPWNSPFSPWMLCPHFEETPFVFGIPLMHGQNYTAAERTLSRRMIRAWSTFAKTGVPDDGKWPRYSEHNHMYQNLDIGSTWNTGEGPHLDNCNFFRPYFGF